MISTTTTTKNLRERRHPEIQIWEVIDTQVIAEALKINVIITVGKRQGKTRVQREEKKNSGMALQSAYINIHKRSQMSEQVRGKQKGKLSSKHLSLCSCYDKSFFPFGKTFPSLSGFKNICRRENSLVRHKQEVALQFLFLGKAKGWSLSLPRGHARAQGQSARGWQSPLTSASTSFFLMPSEESSRFCSFSSSRSARSLAWRIFCSSSVASVLAFTAYQERGNRR